MATASLSENFGVAWHKIVILGGQHLNNLHVQHVIIPILLHAKEDQQHSKKMDWMVVCILSDYSRNINSKDCSELWDEKGTFGLIGSFVLSSIFKLGNYI